MNLTGRRFGRLVVLQLNKKTSPRRTFWDCQCDCGKRTVTRTDALTRGMAQSCGCLPLEKNAQKLTIHGYTSKGRVNGNRTYVSWKGMKMRCNNPNDEHYPDYGARGIRVCDRWVNDFKAFVADMGERPEGLTLDRIDVDGNYEPSNCRWADYFTQNNNTRRNKQSALTAQVNGGFGNYSTMMRAGSERR